MELSVFVMIGMLVTMEQPIIVKSITGEAFKLNKFQFQQINILYVIHCVHKEICRQFVFWLYMRGQKKVDTS